MESDSDSDGSHVSATPPREVTPPSLSSPSPQPPRIHASNNSRIRIKASSSSNSKLSNSKINPSKPTKTQSRHESSQLDPPSNPLSIPTLPFQILRPSECCSTLSTAQFIETVPAGFFSKSTSFSKIRRPFLNLDTSDKESFVHCSDSETWSNVIPSQEGESIPAKADDKCRGGTTSEKSRKRYPNLIGADVPRPSVNLLKRGGEGNFVRLNMGNKRRKFVNKARKKNSMPAGRRSYRRNKGKLKQERKDQMQRALEEDAVIAQTTQQKHNESCGTRQFNCELIEEALSAARHEPSDGNLLNLVKLIYGYDSFRDGQLEAIKMVLAGKSTMLILPTGAGKSLCYQLPSMILPGITLVVSPLVALMIDQLRQLPPVIKGGLLCSSQTPEEASESLKQLQQGTVKVLFVSPERFLNEEFLSIISAASAISLVVVDEAHCISEWSHNFRPSFMRLRASLLKNRLNAGSVLAMTATATTKTLNAIMSALEVPSENLIQKSQLRDNFHLSVSLTRNRMKDLLMLIKSSPFVEVQSIIIYCKFQSETDLISRYLNDYSISAKSYHSGISAKERSYAQDLFSSNKIRVVVATVAFGMGLDKKDVGAVIHYSLPESVEEYVQEIGRAGRDGRLSYCHLFYDYDTYVKLRSLMSSDGVDEYAVNKLLSEVFTADKSSCGKMCSLVKESASRRFDMKEEVILTLLTRLELGDVQYLHLLPQIYTTCTLNFHKTVPQLLSRKFSAVANILKRSCLVLKTSFKAVNLEVESDSKVTVIYGKAFLVGSENKQGQYVFDIPTVANDMGVAAVELSNQLYDLKLMGEITYEMKDLAYCYRILEVPTDFFSLSANLSQWLSEVESCKVRKLDAMFNAAYFTVEVCDKMHGCDDANHRPCLQRKIFDYFVGVEKNDFFKKIDESSPFLQADIKVFLRSNSHAKFTPRAVARIMHGITSPAYPSSTWSKTHFWGRYTHIDFQVVMEAAKAELKKIVGKDMV